MTTKTSTTTPNTDQVTFTTAQTRTLRTLRARYRKHQDLFSARELAHLQFVRWMVQSGRIEP